MIHAVRLATLLHRTRRARPAAVHARARLPGARTRAAASAPPSSSAPAPHACLPSAQRFDQAVEQADTDLRLRGPLEWWIGSVAADASVTEPWIGLPARGLHAAGDLRCMALGVLLVENADSFEQVCKVAGVAKNWLCIWGKGYTSHGMIALLTHFSSLPITAWFDLDADGIKIIDVLEQKLQRQVQPVGMDLELWPSTPHRIQSRKQVDRDTKLAEGLAKGGPLALRRLAHEISL